MSAPKRGQSAHHPTNKNNTAPSASPVSAKSSPDTAASLAEPPTPNIVPISSPNDPYSYRHITLQNGLRALLIVEKPKSAAERARLESAKKKATKKGAPSSNAEADEDVGSDDSKPATVALAVRVGHWSDPEKIPGLAHFCEHMLFMGNTQYPSENEWEEYLSEHGGSSNAFTDSGHTCYYFDINAKYLHPALQRFAQFFISPLFAPSATKREIRAVDSEFRDCFNGDEERMSELVNHTASLVNPQHPAGKWGWGNLESLETNLKPKKAAGDQAAAGKGKKSANGKGKPASSPSPSPQPSIDLRSELKSFHARHYTSNSMCLVVFQASGKLDKLEKWIRTEFEAIPNNGQQAETFESAGHPFLPPGRSLDDPTPPPPEQTCLQRIYSVVPIKEVFKVNVSWILPSFQKMYGKKVTHYAEHLLGHESAGSLYSFLRAKGWITSLVAGISESGAMKNEAFECMQLGISMTKEGSAHVLDILDVTFQYLALIRQPENVKESIYQELQQLSELGFLYSEAQPPEDMVQGQWRTTHTERGFFLLDISQRFVASVSNP